MSFLIVLGSITAVYLMAAASPGPDFLIVTRTSAGLSRRAGVLTALGVATTGAIWSGAAVLGLSFVFERFLWLYGVLKFLGGAYLIYLGVKTWLDAADPPDICAERYGIQAAEGWRYFWMGALTNLTNPKAAVFFGSIFTALLPPRRSRLASGLRGAGGGGELCMVALRSSPAVFYRGRASSSTGARSSGSTALQAA